jgi:hypothetical protein
MGVFRRDANPKGAAEMAAKNSRKYPTTYCYCSLVTRRFYPAYGLFPLETPIPARVTISQTTNLLPLWHRFSAHGLAPSHMLIMVRYQ